MTSVPAVVAANAQLVAVASILRNCRSKFGASSRTTRLTLHNSVDQSMKIPIFYPSAKGSHDFLYSRFPLKGIELFCSKFRDSIKQEKAVYLPDDNLDSWRMIFDWIQRCLDNGAIEDFDVVSVLHQMRRTNTNHSKSDEYSAGVFTRYADIVQAAEYLEVPDRDVAEKVMKRMKTMARAQRGEGQDRRVTWDELGEFCATTDCNR